VTETSENGNGALRRAELADFLRREEVALLAGVGTTWYTWLEQGRDVRASLDVLEALARALKLTPAERTHLVQLGRGEAAPPLAQPSERVCTPMRRMIESLDPTPAYLIGRRWDYLGWNRATAAVFGDFGRIPRATRNHLWQLFTDPARRALMRDWPTHSRGVVAKFRADTARHLGDPAFEELVAALRQVSPEFAGLWNRHEVAQGLQGRKVLHHPVAGELVFEHAVFHPTVAPDQRLVIYSPVPGSGTAEAVAELMNAEPALV
jgi:transcriptional regulator with XRE-family HTH domain